MTLTLNELTKDISTVDSNEILSDWKWKVADAKEVIVVTVLGDLFFLGQDSGIYWLKTDCGEVNKVAEDIHQFGLYLNNENKVDEWFLPLLVEKIMKAGKTIKENEVYSFIKSPVIGGEYSANNIIALDICAHFCFTAQFCQQIEDLPDGTPVSVKIKT
jgi:hypothetical protein